MKKVIEKLKEMRVSNLQTVLDDVKKLSDELENSRIEIDIRTQDAMDVNDYAKRKELSKISEMIYNKQCKLEEVIHTSRKTEEKEKCNKKVQNYISGEMECDWNCSFTNKKPIAFTYNGERYNVSKWNILLVNICNLLYKQNGEMFKSFPLLKDMNGKRKLRFSFSRKELRQAVKIGNSGVFVETNLSAEDIRKEVLKMLKRFDISIDKVKVYIKN